MKSPLIINTDVSFLSNSLLLRRCRLKSLLARQLSRISSQDLSILMNEEIIAINQDPAVGKAVRPFRWGSDVRTIHLSLFVTWIAELRTLHRSH